MSVDRPTFLKAVTAAERHHLEAETRGAAVRALTDRRKEIAAAKQHATDRLRRLKEDPGARGTRAARAALALQEQAITFELAELEARLSAIRDFLAAAEPEFQPSLARRDATRQRLEELRRDLVTVESVSFREEMQVHRTEKATEHSKPYARRTA